MIRLKRLACFSLVLILATGISAMAIDISSIDQSQLAYEDDVDYMAEMLEACAAGDEQSLLEGATAELKRNLKIQTLALDFEETAFFSTYDTADEIAVAIAEHLIAMDIKTVNDEPIQYRIVASSLNIRTGPGADYEKVGSFAYGTIVTFMEKDGEWLRVTDGAITGWCKDTYLAPYDGSQEDVETVAAVDYTEDDLYWLALAIQMEAGSSWLSDEHQLLVGNVILNRVASSYFPNSIYDVIHQAGQYPWAGRGASVTISDRAYTNAKRLLDGERFCPDNVVYQSTSTQGSGVFTSIYDSTLGSTTYFCYI